MNRTIFNCPEPSYEPPEDSRRVFADCVICEDPIHEGDDAYDIPNYGYCCARCIRSAKITEVEVDY